jgi:hypothetical protein
MRPSHGTRPRRKAARTGSFYRRVGVVCVLFASSWTVVYYSGDIPALLQSPAISRSELDVPNGSLLFSPFSDNTCRQSLIDNATGRIQDNGFVDCEVAKSRNAAEWATLTATKRAMAIRGSFVNR